MCQLFSRKGGQKQKEPEAGRAVSLHKMRTSRARWIRSVPNLGGLYALAKTREHHDADRLQVFPAVVSRQRLGSGHLNVSSRLFTPVSFFCRGHLTGIDVGEVILELLFDVLDGALMQRPLVAFQGQQVVASSLDDLLGDLGLRAHGVDGDDRACQAHQLQNLGNRRDFVRFLVASHLGQRQAEVRRPHADRMQGAQAFATIVASPLCEFCSSPTHRRARPGGALIDQLESAFRRVPVPVFRVCPPPVAADKRGKRERNCRCGMRPSYKSLPDRDKLGSWRTNGHSADSAERELFCAPWRLRLREHLLDNPS